MNWPYISYGLRLLADGKIPGLLSCVLDGGCDVRIWLNKIPPVLLRDNRERIHWYQSSNLNIWRPVPERDFHFAYDDGTEFLIRRDGRQIWCMWPREVTVADAAMYLRGPILGMVARLRGMVCLHASAIALGDVAIAILGPCGAGKSTTAAGFAKLGFTILADDVAALSLEGGEFRVLPAHPWLKLWPDAVATLYGAQGSLPRLTPLGGINHSWDKRYLDLEEELKFQKSPLPLAAVYVLGDRSSDDDAPRVSLLSSRDAFVTLTSETYVNYALDQSMRSLEFQVLGRLLETTPVRLVTPHSNPERLVDLCQTILRDSKEVAAPHWQVA